MEKEQQTKVVNILKSLSKESVEAFDDLFRNPENNKQSVLHKEKRMMINCQKGLTRLVQGSHLSRMKVQSIQEYYTEKALIIELLTQSCKIFRLNARFLKEANIDTEGERNTESKQLLQVFRNNWQKEIPVVIYLIKEIYKTFGVQQPPKKSVVYLSNLIQLYYIIVTSNTIPITHLQFITQLLSSSYYQQKLSLQLIQTSFRLIQSGIQQRNIYPYLYFIENSIINAIKVLYNNPKWIFGKGMTVWTWFQLGAVLNQKNKEECTLFYFKTDQNNGIKVRLLKSLDIEVVSIVGNKEVESAKISLIEHKLKINQITMMGLELQVQQGGFLKSNSYSINLRINGSFYKQAIISTANMPKFTSNDMIIDFILFDKFIGKVYSIIISNKNQLSAYEKLSTSFSNYGICNEQYVWKLVESDILKKQHLVGIFNAERSFEGILINYVGQRNLACFSGLVSKKKYNKYDYQIVDVLMPYLYMLIVQNKSQKQENRQKFEQLFDMILKQIIKIISSQQKQSGFIPSEDILFIFYFLQLSQYSISQSTLNYLISEVNNAKESQNIYFQLIGQFLDIPFLMQKGLMTEQIHAAQNSFNPVKKTQFLFLLQSKWQQKWTTQFQGFMAWWSPPFFKYQEDAQFDNRKYVFDERKQHRVQWEVKNFITNDLSKCILMPVFKIPEYADISKYQKEYVGKECFLEDFTLNLGNTKKGNKTILKKFTGSTLDRMKKKILGSSKQKQQSPAIIPVVLTKKVSVKSEFMSECIYIDLLTVIISTVSISKQGFITIVSKHSSQSFDHMCVKAFKNEFLLHYVFHLHHISFIRKRRFNQSMNTLEIRLKSGQIYLLYFHLKNIDNFISILQEHVPIKKDPYSSYLQSKQPFKWIDKQMSNFEYIQWLNDVAGRNFLDIAQYPVLPWVFVAKSDQQKKQQKQYRDLMKNMGSHGTQERIEHFMEKYSSNNQQELFNEYHFGTHYSSSAIIFNYLIRVRPFSIGSLTLQSGKFDCADRIFGSYVGSWQNATNSPTDIRQLIPQIYTLPEMFINLNNYDFGTTQDKLRIDNVDLPRWAKNNPYKFVTTIRKQLESNYVSENINHWIDLIFGYKQRGKSAIEHMNIFFPLTYEDAINLDTVEDPEQRISFETQIAHFGQNPSQIIGNNPHPIRMKTKAAWQDKLFSDAGQGILIQRCNLDNKTKPVKQQKFLYKSIFQSKNSIMSMKFLDDYHFIVIRKHQYFIFKILQKKSEFISKQQEISYELQSTQVSINYPQLGHYVPTTTIGNNVVALGGFFNGYVHFVFTDQPKCNQIMKFQGLNTITAIQYAASYQMLYMADNEGYLKVFEIVFSSGTKTNTQNTKEIEFIEINYIKLHDSKINCLCLNEKANLAATCSNDGFIKLINLYSQQLIRIYRNPDFQHGGLNNSVTFCQISISPLYSICFYSEKTKKIYSYSINGQYLAQFSGFQPDKSAVQKEQHNEFIYNLSIVPASDTTECLTCLTSAKDLFILEMPFLEQKRKIKLKKDASKITCFESCQNGRICLTGTQDAGIQIVADPACY